MTALGGARTGLLIAAMLAAGACVDMPGAERAPAGADGADVATTVPENTPPIPSLALKPDDTTLVADEPLTVPASSAAPLTAEGESGAASVDGLDPDRIVQRGPDVVFDNARFPRPDAVKGLYVNAWGSGSKRRMDALIEIARETEVNALVIDIKDATGYLSHRTEVELAHTIGATEQRRISDLPALLDRLEEENIYPIARIVIVKDPILAAYRPEYAIQDTAGGVWIDSKGIVWLNPYEHEVWRYHVDIAREVAKMGFPEIQWDYVRFPDAPQSDLDRAVYTGKDGRTRAEAIRGFLSYARSNLADLPVRTTADVFGVTTSYRRDIGTGQVWEDFIDVVDVALPMVYPSHYWPGSFGHQEPNARPYEIVRRALEDALKRSAPIEGAGLTRPWLQDFTLGAPAYDAAEVRAQIEATYDAGIEEWILWNPGSSYTVEALEPVGGWPSEPLMRVAGMIAPVSRRHIVIDSIAALPPVADSTTRSGDGTESAAESTDEESGAPSEGDAGSVEEVVADTIPVPATVDSIGGRSR